MVQLPVLVSLVNQRDEWMGVVCRISKESTEKKNKKNLKFENLRRADFITIKTPSRAEQIWLKQKKEESSRMCLRRQ